MRIKQKYYIFGLMTLSLCGHLGLSAAQEKLNPVLEKGIGQYKHENYEEAESLLKQAREEEPSSTLAAYYLGLNYKQLQDYEGAVIHLRDAVTQQPKIKGALIELIDCLYHLNRLEEANKWIEEAQSESIRPAQIAFLKGLVRIKEENYIDAISSFESAKKMDKSLQQASDYQIGIAHLKEKQFDEAQDAFRIVADLRPSSNLAKYANEYIDAISKRKEALRPWQLSFTTAWQYDDNVVLKPEDSAIATDITDKADWRTVYALQVTNTNRGEGKFSVKNQYNFYYAKQNELGFFNTMSQSISVEPRISFDKSLLSFPIAYNHTLVDDRSYLSSPSAAVLYNFSVGNSQMGQAFAQYSHKQFLWTPSTADEDRDGNEAASGFGWYWFFAKKKGFFNLRYSYNKDWTRGNNWKYQGKRVNATLLVPVNDKLNVSLANSVYFQEYDQAHTVFGITRRDMIYTASTLFAYELKKDVEVQLQYTFVRDDSNINIFNYKRNISSAGIHLKF